MLSSDNDNASTSAQSIIECHYRNKYERWYWSLIHTFDTRDQLPENYELHHPVPKELYPSEDWNNTETIRQVGVSFREHFILHLLLSKMGFGLGVTSWSRFVLGFGRGRNKGAHYSNLSQFWKQVYSKRIQPWNTGSVMNPEWANADYYHWVWDNILAENTRGRGCGYPGKGYRNLIAASGGVTSEKVLKIMVNRFREGWVPTECEEWTTKWC